MDGCEQGGREGGSGVGYYPAGQLFIAGRRLISSLDYFMVGWIGWGFGQVKSIVGNRRKPGFGLCYEYNCVEDNRLGSGV